ncbi:tetratricopeptide repeat protein [Scytonema millei]|uniref:Tetratricopeptide repeat protein n=1 Tax=Scytonema millei VB511283 TaxID=1245923 RepID=A0A9X5EAL3_9CYAN|nr:tetratricopeptide repeat protein [Scytonema millei]NHC38302.1 tetratricopeptide repeat protein [Scytonema millei VB511283]
MFFVSKRLTLFIWALLITLGLAVTQSSPLKLAVAKESSRDRAPSNPHAMHLAQATTSQPTVTLFDNLGNLHHPISTNSKLAQRYFDQGLTLAYGFNHAEAARSFQEAAKLDPACAICYWGVALVLGPNINAPMEPEAVSEAWRSLQQALKLSKHASDKEKAYIQALAKRYPSQPVEDRKSFDLAYANAMREVAQRYPDDPDAATLFAESLMDTTPWDYWEDDGTLKPAGKEIIATLESVLKQYPNHPGANHLYIHAVEKERPDLGVASADRLMQLVPNSGHLVHMASHIYIRVGRYHDAVLSNQRGIAADNAYAARNQVEGIYPLAYMPHNHHFLWFAALMTGQSKVATEAALRTAKVDAKLMRQPDLAGALQHFYTIPMYTYIRFGQWDRILSTAAPARDLKYPSGVWHYARGRAFAAKGQMKPAMRELKKLQAIAAIPALQDVKIWGFNSTASILNLASQVLAGEIAAQQKNYQQAIAHLKKAVKLEDALVYTEPADWSQPARQSLGGILLKARRFAQAEQAYRDDLNIYPENGWSLYGLMQSLKAQNKQEEAQVVQKQFEQAWQYADSYQ